jgi:1-carboxybiuret hydrolase
MIDPETSALDIARAVAVGEVSATAITEAALARIAGLNPLLNAFTDVTAARARTQAEALERDARPEKRSARSPAFPSP